jgi:hypothetical protein
MVCSALRREIHPFLLVGPNQVNRLWGNTSSLATETDFTMFSL